MIGIAADIRHQTFRQPGFGRVFCFSGTARGTSRRAIRSTLRHGRSCREACASLNFGHEKRRKNNALATKRGGDFQIHPRDAEKTSVHLRPRQKNRAGEETAQHSKKAYADSRRCDDGHAKQAVFSATTAPFAKRVTTNSLQFGGARVSSKHRRALQRRPSVNGLF